MDWLQALVSLLSAIMGGALVIAGERLHDRTESKRKRAETIVSLYTDFLVSFQVALYHNEIFWSGVAFQIDGEGNFTDSEKAKDARDAAESEFRVAAWRLRLRERDEAQQHSIEELARAFDSDLDDATALTYPTIAARLRQNVRTVLSRMQEHHRKTLDLI